MKKTNHYINSEKDRFLNELLELLKYHLLVQIQNMIKTQEIAQNGF